MKNQTIKIKSYYRNIDSKNKDIFKIQLYGIIAEIILSNNFFKSNKDISDLLDVLNLQYKEYVMRSRTIILARIIRDIGIMNIDDLFIFYKRLGNFLFIDIYNDDNKSNKRNKTKNTIDDILQQFEGSDNN